MNEQSIQKQYNQIVNLLEDKRLKEALVQLDAFLYNGNDWSLRNRLEQIQTSYQYMLQYMKLGMKDPERQKLYRQLLADTWEIADQTRIALLDEISTHYYHSLRRNPKQLPKAYGISTLQKILEGFADEMAVSQLANYQGLDAILRRHEETHQVMFLTTWSNSSWTLEEFAQAEDMLRSETLPTNDLCLFVSAVTLSLMECFDERKVNWLLDGLRHTNPQINQRALVGLVITLHLYPSRIALYPELEARISLFREDPNFSKQVNRIYIQLLRSQETEKIDRKMREEIIPQMLKTQHLINPDMKIEDIEDLEEFNPEWKKSLDMANEKIRELGELQMEGADTYMGTFAQLKTFPFFQQAAHWFYPFSTQISEVASILPSGNDKGNNLIRHLLELPMFCNSDRYSFCFTFMTIPQVQQNIVTSQLAEQDLHLNESIEQLVNENRKGEKTDITAKLYLQDLYRFFKLWPFRKEQHDIFTDDLALWKCKPLAPLNHTTENLSDTANQLFSKGYWQEAADLFRDLGEKTPDNPEVMQKLGFSLLKLKKYPRAAQAFQQADLLKPDHVWTLRHLAQCYKHMHDYPKALEYFEKVKEIQPDNLNLLLQIGQCLATQRMYDQALTYFFKVEYLDKTPVNARRAIGWCYFMTGKYEEALRFYQKLLQTDDAQASDWLNAGHVYLAQKNIPKALEHYRQAESMCETHEKFVNLFQADKEALTERQVQEETLCIIPDLL